MNTRVFWDVGKAVVALKAEPGRAHLGAQRHDPDNSKMPWAVNRRCRRGASVTVKEARRSGDDKAGAVYSWPPVPRLET